MTINIIFLSCLAHFFLEWEMFQKKFVEEIKIHILCSVTFFFENHAVYEKKWNNFVEQGRPQMAIWPMHTACWMPKATNTHKQVFNTQCFSTETMVAVTRLNVKLFVHFLSFCFYYVRCLRFRTCRIITWCLSRIIRRGYLDILRFEIYGL
jgi:hypothetical protein